MSKRRISREEITEVLALARAGVHGREIARRTTVSTQGVTGICARHGVKLSHGKRGPIRREPQTH